MRPEVTADGLGKLGSAFAGLAELGGFDDVAKQRYPHVERIDHVHTAGNSSGIVDGAALVLVGSEEAGRVSGLTPRARIIAAATSGADPVLMFEGPIPVVNKALAIADLSVADIDVFEMNEAFAPSPCTSKRRSTSRTTATTSTAAPSPWATPWGRRGRGSARGRGSGAHRAPARHPERADVGAAQRRPHEAVEGPQGGRGRRVGRLHRRARARSQGLDHGQPGRPRAALGCPRLHDPRRHPVDPGVHGVSACLPGEPAPPAQRSADARSPGDHGRGRRGRPGRLRHGVDHRDPVLHQPGHRPGGQKHDPGVLLRPAGRAARRLPAERCCEEPADQGGDRRCRDDGRRHRLCDGQGRHRRGAQGRHPRGGAERKSLWRGPRGGHTLQGADHRGAVHGAAQPDHPHRGRRRLRGRRHCGRSGVRKHRAEAPGVCRDRGSHRSRRSAGLQYLVPPDHRIGHGRDMAGELRRHPLLLTGDQDGPRRGHPRRADLGRDVLWLPDVLPPSSTTVGASSPRASSQRSSPRRSKCCTRGSTRR